MDVLRALASPNLDIRKKTIDIVLELITQRNIDEANPTPPPSPRIPLLHPLLVDWSSASCA